MTTKAKLLQLSLTLIAVGVLAACGATAMNSTAANAGGGSSHIVTLKSIQFHPGTLRIKRGDSVQWAWEDGDISTQHNVTSIGRTRFRSSSTKMTGTYTVTFTSPGSYAFECTIHPASMQGTVVVQ